MDLTNEDRRITVHLHDFGSWVGASIQGQYIPVGINHKGVKSAPEDWFNVRTDCAFPPLPTGETDAWFDLIFKDAWVDNRPEVTLKGKLILHCKKCSFAPPTFGRITDKYGRVYRTIEEADAEDREKAGMSPQKAPEEAVKPFGEEPTKVINTDTGEVMGDDKLPW